MPGASRQGVKPADPQLEQGRQRDSLRPFGAPRWLGARLYLAFSFLLLLPLLRRLRRRPSWNVVRIALAAAGLVLMQQGWWAGALLTAAGLLIKRSSDPDHERKLQRRHRADYLVNGGLFVGGELPNREPLDARDGLSLLLRGGHLLLVPARDGEVHSAANVREIEKILVDGRLYRPVYVSEAKDPPVREEHVDQNAASELELVFEDGKRWRFRYVGAFHKHLAETAAHAIHSVREIARNPQASGSARSFPIVRP